MTTVYDVSASDLISRTAAQLKTEKKMTPPEWAVFVKTGANRERPPVDPDWWYVRAASVLRRVYMSDGHPIGVQKLRHKYGGRKNNGMAPEHYMRGSGNILRKILQQLEAAKFVTQKKDGQHKGRLIAPAGKSYLDNIAATLKK